MSSFFIQPSPTFRFFVHLFWLPPTTQAAIALQTHLAYPPPIPWPCATTTTLPSSTLSRFFVVSPVKTGTLPTFFFPRVFSTFFVHWACTHHTCSTRPLCPGFGPICAPFCAPLRTLCAPSVHLLHTPVQYSCFSFHFLGLSPSSDILLTLDPLPATLGNPALVQLGTAPTPDLSNQFQL